MGNISAKNIKNYLVPAMHSHLHLLGELLKSLYMPHTPVNSPCHSWCSNLQPPITISSYSYMYYKAQGFWESDEHFAPLMMSHYLADNTPEYVIVIACTKRIWKDVLCTLTYRCDSRRLSILIFVTERVYICNYCSLTLALSAYR